MTRTLACRGLLLMLLLAGCSEVPDPVLTPSIIGDRSKLDEVSRRLNAEDKAHLHQYIIGHRLAQFDPEKAPPAYAAGSHTVSEAIEISRRLNEVDASCRHKLMPVSTRLAEVRHGVERDEHLIEALVKIHATVSNDCAERRRAIQ